MKKNLISTPAPPLKPRAFSSKKIEKTLFAHLIFEPEENVRFFKQNQFHFKEIKNRIFKSLFEIIFEQIEDHGEFSQVFFRTQVEKGISLGDSTGKPLLEPELLGQILEDPFKCLGVPFKKDLKPLLEKLRSLNVTRKAHTCLKKYAKIIEKPTKDSEHHITNSIWELQQILDRGREFYWTNIDHHVSDFRKLIQKNKKKKKGYLGLDFDFPILAEKLNGIQNEFYLIAGTSGMGKTSFVTHLAWSILNLNPDCFVIIVSLDLSSIDITARLVAHCGQLDLNYVKNPSIANIQTEKKRQQAMYDVSLLKERTCILDEGKGPVFLDDIKKMVRSLRGQSQNDILLVIDTLDGVHLNSTQHLQLEEKANLLSAEFRTLARSEQISILATTAMLRYNPENNRPSLKDLNHVVRLLYDPYAILTLYKDLKFDPESPFQEWEWNEEGAMVPVVECSLLKNKMGPDMETFFYRFIESGGRFKECHVEEIKNYNAMITNLEKHEKERKNPPPKFRT